MRGGFLFECRSVGLSNLDITFRIRRQLTGIGGRLSCFSLLKGGHDDIVQRLFGFIHGGLLLVPRVARHIQPRGRSLQRRLLGGQLIELLFASFHIGSVI